MAELCPSCREPLDYPSGDGCAAMTKHERRKTPKMIDDNITLDTDELGIWLVNETDEGPQQMGHISWVEIAKGVKGVLLLEMIEDMGQEFDKRRNAETPRPPGRGIGETTMTDFTKSEAAQAERDRCLRIIQAARSGDIDTDMRTLIHFISSGRDVVLNEETGTYRLAD